jgi:glycosyltransferase involved in cell wall biosynthesis
MKVVAVLVGATTRTGGPPAFVGGCALELARHGHEMTVLSTDLALAPHGLRQHDQRPSRLSEVHPDLMACGVRLHPAREPRRIAYSPELAQAIDAEVAQADLVHIHNLWLYPQYAAFRAAKRHGVPYVVSPHGSLEPYLRRTGRARKWVTSRLWQNRMLDGASMFHVTTATERDSIGDVAPHVPRVIVPCGVYADEFSSLPGPEVFRRKRMNGYEGAVVSFVGRVTDKKGVDVLIRAFARARARIDARLAIIGPDDEGLTLSLKRIVAQLGLRDDVVFLGPLYGRDLLEALSGTDVWALASHTENFGIAVVEAMAAGRAVIVSPGVNLAGEIDDAAAGVVAEATPDQFGKALGDLLVGDEARKRLECAAVDFARRYDWQVVGPELITAYDTVSGCGDTHRRNREERMVSS